MYCFIFVSSQSTDALGPGEDSAVEETFITAHGGSKGFFFPIISTMVDRLGRKRVMDSFFYLLISLPLLS